MRRYYIKTYGCQMNIADSGKLADVLEAAGYQEAQAEAQADIILVNTCVVRQNAEDRAAGYISSIKSYKEKNPHLKIGVCGCLVSEPGREVENIFPHVDIFIAPNQPERLKEFIIQIPYSPSPRGRGGGVYCASGGEGNGGSLTKYITIMHGCDNFCSYCIVPYVRGREYSRPIEEIMDEIKQVDLEKQPEIFLLGQNVNSYKYGLARLLGEIKKIVDSRMLKAESRIRFMTSHPRDMSDDIINAVAELPHVCEYFHLPIQHGDDQILKSMNRGYSYDDYRRLVDRIRARIPDAAITSDVIIGYPGETDHQFQNTLKAIQKIGFDACNTAAYSVRPATAAAKLTDDVPHEVKQQRLQEAMKVVEKVAKEKNEKLIGSTQEVLADKYIPYSPSPSRPERSRRIGRGGGVLRVSGGEGYSSYSGRTRTNKIVKFESPENNLLGKLLNVRINSAQSWILKGELINGKF
jgi:tRNA-2-methylthio-N6-dimethylallyladenosine synthase